MAAYLVTTPTGERLIEARTAAAAKNFVVADTVTVKTLNVGEVLSFINKGMKPETIPAKVA